MAEPARHRPEQTKPVGAGLHEIELSIFPSSEIPKGVPQWIHFTPGNGCMWGGRKGARNVSLNQIVALQFHSKQLCWASLSRYRCLILSSQLPPPLLVFLSLFQPLSHSVSRLLYCCQIQTLLAVIGYSSQPWNDTYNPQICTAHIPPAAAMWKRPYWWHIPVGVKPLQAHFWSVATFHRK